jgi:hypothetical protein
MAMAIRIEAREERWAAAPMLAVGLGVVAAAVSLLHLDRLPFSFCFFKTVTGIPCMTCGTTRAFGRLASFDLPGALRVNPLATVVVLGVLAYAAVDLALLAGGRRLTLSLTATQARWLWIGAGVLLLVNWMYLIVAGI